MAAAHYHASGASPNRGPRSSRASRGAGRVRPTMTRFDPARSHHGRLAAKCPGPHKPGKPPGGTFAFTRRRWRLPPRRVVPDWRRFYRQACGRSATAGTQRLLLPRSDPRDGRRTPRAFSPLPVADVAELRPASRASLSFSGCPPTARLMAESFAAGLDEERGFFI